MSTLLLNLYRRNTNLSLEKICECNKRLTSTRIYKGEVIIMGLAAKKLKNHPYISVKKGVCGGRNIIEGTRIPVWSIIKWYKLGLSLEEIMREFPQLSPAQIHDAFSYYYDHLNEIEKDIRDNEDEPHARKKQIK
jgi:uncharacterized protein (DUF433 family)